MKKIKIPVLILMALSVVIFAGEVDQKAQKKIAVNYFEKLTSGDITAANEMVTVPFSLDLKKVLKTKEEVIEFHKKMLESKGKRDIPEYTIAVTKEAIKLDDKIFPQYTPFRIKMKEHGHLDIYVTSTKNPLVIGFAD